MVERPKPEVPAVTETSQSRLRVSPPPSDMTIGQAKDYFGQFQRDLETDYTNLIRLFRSSGIEAPIANSNYAHGLGLVAGMFSETNRSLRMLTGNSHEAIPELLFKKFEEMLHRIRENAGKAQIIVVDGRADELEPMRARFPNTLQVALANATVGAEISHFIVCDSDMVREEEYHKPLRDEDSADLVKAKIYCAAKGRATALSQLFDGIWSKLTKR